MPTAPRKPQDRKPKKAADEDVPEAFSFDHDGETYTFLPTASVFTPGFIRQNRNEDETEVTFTLLEKLAGDKVLDVLDNMSFAEHRDVLTAFGEYITAFMGATPGESSAS